MTKPPQKASLIDVLAVHEEGYVTRVLGCALTEKEGRAIGFPMMNPSQVTRSLASSAPCAKGGMRLRGCRGPTWDFSAGVSLPYVIPAQSSFTMGPLYGRV